MKKIAVLFLIFIFALTLTGCKEDPVEIDLEEIDYEDMVDVPTTISVSLDDIPDDFSGYVTVATTDEDLIENITVDTSSVTFTEAGDYNITVTVEFSDGEESEYQVVLTILPIDDDDDIVVIVGEEPTITGIKNYVVPVDSTPLDLVEGVVFADNDTVVDSGVIGEVDYSRIGKYNLEYFVEDNDGNIVTLESFVIVGEDYDIFYRIKPHMFTMTPQEVNTIEEISLLFLAATYYRDLYYGGDYMYYGSFITKENISEFLNRDLRDDEVLAISEFQNMMKKNDKLYIEDILNRELTPLESDSIDIVYDVYTAYAKTVSTDINHYYSEETLLSDSNLFSLYLADDSVSEEVTKQAISFYKRYVNLDFDFRSLRAVIEYTDFSLTEDDIDFIINKGDNEFQFEEFISNRDYTLIDETGVSDILGRDLTEDELTYFLLYKDYYHNYLLYRSKSQFDFMGIENIDSEKLKMTIDIVDEALTNLLGTWNNNLSYNSYIHIGDLVKHLDRSLTPVELEAVIYHNTGYQNQAYSSYDLKELVSVYGDDITEEQEVSVMNTYNLLYDALWTSEYEYYGDILQMETHDVQLILGRAMTVEEYNDFLVAREFFNFRETHFEIEVLSNLGFTFDQLRIFSLIGIDTVYEYAHFPSYDIFIEIQGEDITEESIEVYLASRKYVMMNAYYNEFHYELDDTLISLLQDVVDIFIIDDFSIHDFYAFLESYSVEDLVTSRELTLSPSQTATIEAFYEEQYKPYEPVENLLTSINRYLFRLTCSEECFIYAQILYDYSGNNSDIFGALTRLDTVLEIEAFMLERTGSESHMSSEEIEAYEYIYNSLEIADVEYQVMRFVYYVDSAMISENLDNYVLLYRFCEENSLRFESIVNSDNILASIGDSFTITSELEAAIEIIEDVNRYSLNTLIFKLFYNEDTLAELEISLEEYILIYNLLMTESIMFDIELEGRFPDVNVELSTEEQAAYNKVSDYFDSIYARENLNGLLYSRFMTQEDSVIIEMYELLLTFGIDIAVWRFTPESIPTNQDYIDGLNTLDEDTKNKLQQFVYEFRLEEMRSELWLYYLDDVSFETLVMSVEFALELIDNGADYQFSLTDIEIILDRALTDDELLLLDILNENSRELLEYFFYDDTTPFRVQLSFEEVKEIYTYVSILNDTQVDEVYGFYHNSISVIELEQGLNFTETELEAIRYLLNREIKNIASLAVELNEDLGYSSLSDARYEELEDLIFDLLRYFSLAEIADLNVEIYNIYHPDNQIDLADYDQELIGIIGRLSCYNNLYNFQENNSLISDQDRLNMIKVFLLDKEVGDFMYIVGEDQPIYSIFHYFEFLGRDLTPEEAELVIVHNELLARIGIRELIDELQISTLTFFTPVERAEFYELIHLYLEASYAELSLYDLLAPEVPPIVVGRALTIEEIALIEQLYNIDTE